MYKRLLIPDRKHFSFSVGFTK